MKNNGNKYEIGIGVTGLLLVAFIVLKLTHVIDWSWWWVLAPAWGPLVIFLLFMAAAIIITIIKNI